MSEDPCVKCKREVPLKGYVCEWCTALILQRIRNLPPNEVHGALDQLDRDKLGFVPPYKTPEERFEEATEKLKELAQTMRDKYGIDVETIGE